MRTIYEFTEGDVKGIWGVGIRVIDENNPDAWQPAPVGFGGGVRFTFDKKKIFSYWPDYPDNLTPEQIQLFNKAFPYWGEFKDWGGCPPDAATAQDGAPSIWDTRF